MFQSVCGTMASSWSSWGSSKCVTVITNTTNDDASPVSHTPSTTGLVASVTTAVGTVADKAKQGAATLKETAARQVAEVMAEGGSKKPLSCCVCSLLAPPHATRCKAPGDEGSASKASDVLPWEAAPARYRDEMKEVILKLSSDNRTYEGTTILWLTSSLTHDNNRFTSDPPAEVEFAFDFAVRFSFVVTQ